MTTPKLETTQTGKSTNRAAGESGNSIPPHLGADEIQAWLVNQLSKMLKVESGIIDVNIPFERFGVDSSMAIGLVGDLEKLLKRDLDPTLLYDYPTICSLAIHLAGSNSLDNH